MKTSTPVKEVEKEKIPSYRPRYQLRLNETQLKAYQLLIYGLKSLSKEELDSLNEEDKRTVIYNNDKTWKIINRVKQQKLNKLLTKKIKKVFPDLTGDATPFLLQPIIDNNFLVNPDLRECNLSQQEIITSLIETNLLPFNFLK